MLCLQIKFTDRFTESNFVGVVYPYLADDGIVKVRMIQVCPSSGDTGDGEALLFILAT